VTSGTDATARLRDVPEVICAPMAGGPTTVELAAAVCEAGGLGFLAAGYLSTEALSTQVDALRARTARPFGANVFLVRPAAVDEHAVAAYLDELAADARAVGATVGSPRFDDDGFAEKLAVLRDARLPVVSFTFGCPDPQVVAALHAVGTAVWTTVTSLAEAEQALGAGSDALVAQGAEAGGHRGSFVDDGGVGALDTCSLVRALTAGSPVPVVAAGGIATAADAARARAAGATGVQAGTAFLLADEAGTHPAHRARLGTDQPTAWTRAFTGRTARGIVNGFVRDHPSAPSAYPQVHHATAPIRAAARAAGDGERINLWAGTRHGLARSAPAGEIVASLRG
jgi:nitronate monooxygenase